MYATIVVAVLIAFAAEVDLAQAFEPQFNPASILIWTILVTALAPVPGVLLARSIKPEQLADRSTRPRVLKRVRIVSLAYQVYLLGSFAVVIHLIRWPLLTEGTLHLAGWVLVDEVLRLAPFLCMLVLAWMPLYRIDRMLRGGTWSMHEYIEFHFRQYVLFILVPFAMIVTVKDVVALVVTGEVGTALDGIVLVAAVGVFFCFWPLLLRYVWRTRPLEAGPLRRRLQDLCQRAGMGCRDILVWETMGGHVVNACVVGIAARVRFIMVSDALTEALTPEEIEGVFAHEVAHVTRHHMLYYVLFAVAFGALFVLLASAPLPLAGSGEAWQEALWGGALVLLYWGVGFAFVSRRMEVEADVYGVELTGSTTDFVNALERISFFSGRPRSANSWRHFSIEKRTRFLQACEADPQRMRRFKKEMSILRWGIVAFTACAVAAAAIAAVLS